MKKIIWLVVDGTEQDTKLVGEALRNVRLEGYLFVLSNKRVEVLSKEEIIDLLERAK